MAKISLIELAKTFLKIGILSFGGPYAHISLFEDELINNKKHSLGGKALSTYFWGIFCTSWMEGVEV